MVEQDDNGNASNDPPHSRREQTQERQTLHCDLAILAAKETREDGDGPSVRVNLDMHNRVLPLDRAVEARKVKKEWRSTTHCIASAQQLPRTAADGGSSHVHLHPLDDL